MSERACHVVVRGGKATAFYSPWGAQDVPELVACGPDDVADSVSSYSSAEALMEAAFAEGGVLVDFDDRLAIVFVWPQAPFAGPEAFLRSIAPAWPSGWTLRWDERGSAAFAWHLRDREIEEPAWPGELPPRWGDASAEVVERPGGAAGEPERAVGPFFRIPGPDDEEALWPDEWKGHRGFSGPWPQPRAWVESPEPAGPRSGVLLQRAVDLPWWLAEAGHWPELWTAEAEDAVVGWRGVFARRARLVRRLDWNEQTDRLWACDCAERALAVYEAAFPGDDRPRGAIVARRAAVDDPSWAFRDPAVQAGFEAAKAAWAAGSRAAGAAASATVVFPGEARWSAVAAASLPPSLDGELDAVTRDDELRWQIARLLETYLGLDPTPMPERRAKKKTAKRAGAKTSARKKKTGSKRPR